MSAQCQISWLARPTILRALYIACSRGQQAAFPKETQNERTALSIAEFEVRMSWDSPNEMQSLSDLELPMSSAKPRIVCGGGAKLVVALTGFTCLALVLSGCPKGKDAFSAGRMAENRKDFDSALEYYKLALQTHPSNVEYKVKVADISFEAAQAHVSEGQKLREKGDLDRALLEFEKAQSIDP